MSAAAAAPDPSEAWRRPPLWAPWETIALLLAAGVASVLRFHEYTLAPKLADNQDPVQFAWAGLTFITKHVPYSWEITPTYHYDFVLHANGADYAITHPWITHPPLFSFLMGAWVYIQGARELTDVTVEMVRPLAILLGLLSLLLAYELGRRVVGRRTALAAVVLLAVSPGAVLLSREVELETLMAPMLLLALIQLHRLHTGEGGRGAAAVILVICLLLPTVKVSGVILAGAIAVILLAAGRWRLAVAVGMAGALGFGLFAAWGALFDFGLWLRVMAEWQTHRHGVMAGFEFISDSAGIGRAFRDGWWQLGFIGLGAMIIRGRSGPRPMLLATVVVVYAAGLAVIGDVLVQGRYGWYRLVLYPLVYMAAAYLAVQSVKRPSIPGTLIVLVLGGATATVMITGKLWEPNPYLLSGVIGLGLVPVAIMLWRRKSLQWERVAQVTTGALLAAVVVTSAIESWNLARIYTQI